MSLRSLSAALALVLVACGDSTDSTGSTGNSGGSTSSDPNRPQTVLGLTGNATSGKSLYDSNCAVCHGADGKTGTAKENTPAEAKQNASAAVNIMLSGKEEMPAFSGLSDQNLADILSYLQSL